VCITDYNTNTITVCGDERLAPLGLVIHLYHMP
jgi:hypothetical protein